MVGSPLHPLARKPFDVTQVPPQARNKCLDQVARLQLVARILSLPDQQPASPPSRFTAVVPDDQRPEELATGVQPERCTERIITSLVTITWQPESDELILA